MDDIAKEASIAPYVEALRLAPIIGPTETAQVFRIRQDKWLTQIDALLPDTKEQG